MQLLIHAYLVATALIHATDASPFQKRAATGAGATSTDLYPPPNATLNTALFPGQSQIGYPGVVLTGAFPAAIQTAAAFPANTAPFAPLVFATPLNSSTSSNGLPLARYWGNLAPWYTVNSSFYGLPSASPQAPSGCSITQVNLLYRHGARYPTTGAPPSTFAAKVHNAALTGGYNATGALSFLNDWTYKLGAEYLTPFGRQQNFDLGVQMRTSYGYLLSNFTKQGNLPVFRTESQDRMVKTALNFMAGFFGIPEYQTQAQLEIVVEAPGFNNTGAPYETCTNSNVANKGQIGSAIAANWTTIAFTSTAQRLQSMVTGINVTASDVLAMLQLCSYETNALGYSAFCGLFTEEDFRNYEYYFDLSFYYNNGFGSPVAASQGKGYLEEFLARLQMQALTEYNSTTNATLDQNNITFPLQQSIYADATHEVVVLDTLTAFNLSALFSSGPLPFTSRPANQSFVASQIVPFGTHFTIQVMECSNRTPSKQIRFILNDAVLPIANSYAGCTSDADGLCSFDNVLSVLRQRVKEIDFNKDCFGNYTVVPGMDYNGRSPSS